MAPIRSAGRHLWVPVSEADESRNNGSQRDVRSDGATKEVSCGATSPILILGGFWHVVTRVATRQGTCGYQVRPEGVLQ